MAGRQETVRMLVLGCMCDDYENLTVSIAGPVMEDGAKLGWAIVEEEIVAAIGELVAGGLAKGYRLYSDGNEELTELPTLEEMRDPNGAWFYAQPEGIRAFIDWRDSDRNPLDDEHELKKDWTPLPN